MLNRRQVLHRKAGAQRREREEARRDSDTESRLLMAPDFNICAVILDVTEEEQGEERTIEMDDERVKRKRRRGRE